MADDLQPGSVEGKTVDFTASAVDIRDVARRAGVSVGTVSNVVNHPERVAAETIERVRRAMNELRWRPNEDARAMALSRRTHPG